MKILVLKSSGNKNGSSNMLADEFIRGASEAGNEVLDYDVFRKEIRPCRGCGACGMDGPCVQKDDFENELKDLMRAADMIVFTMPVYYYNWPAQIKTVVDRVFSFNGELTAMEKKAVLLTVASDNNATTFSVVKAAYDTVCRYLHFKDCGTILGGGCGSPEATRASIYPGKAYELGKSFR